MWVFGAVGLLLGCTELESLSLEGAPFRTVSALVLQRSCRKAADCPGRKCIHLRENLQRVAGFCSRSCFSDEDCGEGGICFALGKAGPSCLAKCGHSVNEQTEPPCPAGLVCVPVGAEGEEACFVEPAHRPTAGRGAG